MEAKSGSLRRWMPLICDIVHLKISGLSSPLKQKEKLVVQYVCKMMNTMKNIQKGDDENGNMAPSSPVTLPDDVWPLAKPRTKTLCRVLAKGRDSHLSKQRTPLVVPVNKQVSRAQVQMYGGKGFVSHFETHNPSGSVQIPRSIRILFQNAENRSDRLPLRRRLDRGAPHPPHPGPGPGRQSPGKSPGMRHPVQVSGEWRRTSDETVEETDGI